MSCRKLRLQEGERLLDVGCGWGALITHAVKNYGVIAHGITISDDQASLAQERIHEMGLEGRCTVEVRDFRDIPQTEYYDKVAAVGIAEHLGTRLLPPYFEKIWQVLRPGGVLMNHAISADVNSRDHEQGFLNDLFPDTELVSLQTIVGYAADVGFEVHDVESLREHYYMTVLRWLERLEANEDRIIKQFGKPLYRSSRLGLLGGAYSFIARHSNLYQIVLSKAEGFNANIQLSRADWYQGTP